MVSVLLVEQGDIEQNDLVQQNWIVETSDDVPVKRILFDETHGELLDHQDTTELQVLLDALPGVKVVSSDDISSDECALGNGLLKQHSIDILVVAAPTIPFSSEEINAIENFLEEGKSFLFASSHTSLGYSEVTQQINDLLKDHGLQAQRLVGHRPRSIQSFSPHYLSSGVSRLAVQEPTSVKLLSNSPLAVAAFSESDKPFLAAVEFESSRVIAVGDVSFLKNDKINQDDNQILALNIFRWLASKNLVDVQSVRIDPEIRYGEQSKVALRLINSCIQERLDGVRCLLESNEATLIEKPQASLGSISVKGMIKQSWQIEPQKLGLQSLRLTVEIPEERGGDIFSIDPIAQFQCVPNADIKLVIDNQKGKVKEIVETGTPFNVSASVRWEENAKQIPLHFSLEAPSSLAVEQLTESHWRLTALSDGKWVIKIRVQETSQEITQLIYAEPSLHYKINKVEREVVSELEAKIAYRLSQFLPELDIETIQQVPFKLLTPEDYVEKVYPAHMQEKLMEILYTIRHEEEAFSPLVSDLLFYVAPMYSPKHGCCIPYDPELAAYLIEKYPFYEQNIAYNFLWAGEKHVYGHTWLEGNVAALLLHEKYGHGFFYTQTKLGQQLSILYRHGLLRKVDNEILKAPYLRVMHEEYGEVIRMLSHSALLLNEGFATWLETVGLQRLGGALEETVHRRREFLFQDTELEQLYSRSKYFKVFDPRPGSKYELGYIWLKDIQNHFSVKLGLKSVIDAVVRAADVDFGISENDGRIEFALGADRIKELLFDDRRGFEAGAQRRLGEIWSTVGEYFDELEAPHTYHERRRIALQAESPVNKILGKILGW